MVTKKHEVKVTEKSSKTTDSVNFEIEVDGKRLSLSVNGQLDYVLIHSTTTFTDVTFASMTNAIIDNCNEDGTLYSIKLGDFWSKNNSME